MRRSLLVLFVLPSLLFAVQPDALRVRPAAAVLAPAGEVMVADEAFSQLDSSVASTGSSTLVAWTDGFRVKAQAFGRTLQPIGERLELIAGTPVTRLTLATNGDTYLLLGSEPDAPALAWQISAGGALLAGPHQVGSRWRPPSIRWNGADYEAVFGIDRQLLDATGTPVGPAAPMLDASLGQIYQTRWATNAGTFAASFLTARDMCRILCPGTALTYTPYLMFADGRIVQQVEADSWFQGGQGPAHAVANGPIGSLFVWASGLGALARRFDAEGTASDPVEGVRVTRPDRTITALYLFPTGRDFLLVYDQQTSVQGRLLSDIEAVTISLESGAGVPFVIAADAEATELLDEAILEGSRLLVSYRIEGDPHGTKIMLRSMQMPSARQRGVRR